MGVGDGNRQGEGYGRAYKSGTSISDARPVTNFSLSTIGGKPSANIDWPPLNKDSSFDNVEKEFDVSQHAFQQPSSSNAQAREGMY